MSISGLDNIGIAVGDVDAVARFFSDTVGLTVERDDSAEPRAAMVYIGDHYLYVFATRGSRIEARRSSDLVSNTPGIDHVSVRVSDVDAEYERLRSQGLEFDGQPESVEEWGIRLVGFRDPEGNAYYLVQNV